MVDMFSNLWGKCRNWKNNHVNESESTTNDREHLAIQIPLTDRMVTITTTSEGSSEKSDVEAYASMSKDLFAEFQLKKWKSNEISLLQLHFEEGGDGLLHKKMIARVFPMLMYLPMKVTKWLVTLLKSIDEDSFKAYCLFLRVCYFGSSKEHFLLLFKWFCNCGKVDELKYMTSRRAAIFLQYATVICKKLEQSHHALELSTFICNQKQISFIEFINHVEYYIDPKILLWPFYVLPTATMELDHFKSLYSTFSSSSQIRSNDTVFAIDKNWWDAWLKYIDWESFPRLLPQIKGPTSYESNKYLCRLPEGFENRPGIIENSTLEGKLSGTLKCSAHEGTDYYMIPQSIWDFLYALYGGGPVFPRKVLVQSITIPDNVTPGVVPFPREYGIDLNPFLYRVSLAGSDGRPRNYTRQFFFSQDERLRVILDCIYATFGVHSSTSRLWYKTEEQYWLLLPIKDMSLTVFELQKMGSPQELLIETKDFQRNWPRKKLPVNNKMRDFLPLGKGDIVEAMDCDGIWRLGKVVDRDCDDRVRIFFKNMSSNYDEWIYEISGKLQPVGTIEKNEKIGSLFSAAVSCNVESCKYISFEGINVAAGLWNLGNTCFINCALQCICHNIMLRSYFLSSKYIADINSSESLGSRGAIARAFAKVIKSLWTNSFSVIRSKRPIVNVKNFYETFIKYQHQFAGYDQHDVGEFCSSLLSSMHEDLIRLKIRKKLIKNLFHGKHGNSNTSSSCKEDVSSKDSIIVDLFYGQLRSMIICNHCSVQSLAYEPFMFISVPIVQKDEVKIIVNVLMRRELDDAEMFQFSVEMSKLSSIFELKYQVSTLCDLLPCEMVATNVLNHHTIRVLLDEEHISNFLLPQQLLKVFFFEKPIETKSYFKESVFRNQSWPNSFEEVEIGLYLDAKTIFGRWRPGIVIDKEKVEDGGIKVLVSYHKDFPLSNMWYTFDDWEKKYLCPLHQYSVEYVGKAVDIVVVNRRYVAGIFQPSFCPIGKPFIISISETTTCRIFLKLLNNQVRLYTKSCYSGYGYHVSLVSKYNILSKQGQEILPDETIFLSQFQSEFQVAVDWNVTKYEASNLSDVSFRSKNDGKGDLGSNSVPKVDHSVALESCFDAEMESEHFDAYWCENCQNYKPASKKMDFWELPDNINIHLKRFQSTESGQKKVKTLVQFPLRGLDMTKWYGNSDTNCGSMIYDLYAVANHIGDMNSGHYIAYCLYETNDKSTVLDACKDLSVTVSNDLWVGFDDEVVAEVPPERIVSQSAYILFYRRRYVSVFNRINLFKE